MKHLPFIFIALLFVSCNMYTFRIDTQFDKFEGTTYYYMVDNYYPTINEGYHFCFNVQKFVPKTGEPSYNIVIKMWASDWLFIEEGESLVLLLDGHRCGLSGDGSREHRNVSGGSVDEIAFYKITPDQLEQIVDSKEVRIKVIGDQHYIEGRFSEQNFSNLKRFIAEYVSK